MCIRDSVLPLYEDTENYTDSSLPGAIGITTAGKDVEVAKRAVDFISSSKAQQIYADAQPGIYLNKNVKMCIRDSVSIWYL